MASESEKDKRVLFLGFACIELASIVTRLPESDGDLRAVQQSFRGGGNAHNSSVFFANLLRWNKNKHFSSEYMGNMTNDFAGQFLRQTLNECDVLTENAIINHDPKYSCPGSSVLINASDATRAIIWCDHDLPAITLETFASKITPRNIENYSWIHFEAGGNTFQTTEFIRYVRQIESDSGIKFRVGISVEIERPDPNLMPLFDEDVDLFFVSKEFAMMKGSTEYNKLRVFEHLLQEWSQQIAKSTSRRECVTAVVPWGELGAVAVHVDKEKGISRCESRAYRPVNGVIDTTAAGDSFNAAVIFARHVLKLDPQESIAFGCRFAAAKCGLFIRSCEKILDHFDQYVSD